MTKRNAPLIVASAIASISISAAVIAALTVGTASAAGVTPSDVSPTPSVTISVTPPAPTVTVTQTVTAHPTPTNTKPTLHLTKTIHVVGKSVDVLRFGARRQVVTMQLLRGGHDSGRGVETCLVSHSNAAVFSCKTAYALKTGVFLFRATINVAKGTLNGTITGGSGDYAGARGSITGSAATTGRGVNVAISYYT